MPNANVVQKLKIIRQTLHQATCWWVLGLLLRERVAGREPTAEISL